MDIEIKLEESRKTPKIIILTDKITDEVSELVQRLKSRFFIFLRLTISEFEILTKF